MQFKIWVEERGLGTIPAYGNNTMTPASDKVKQTGLQPQVDSHEIHTKEKEDTDSVLAIDAKLEKIENEFPEPKGPKVKKFKKLWDKFKEKWETIKMKDSSPPIVSPNKSPVPGIPSNSMLGMY